MLFFSLWLPVLIITVFVLMIAYFYVDTSEKDLKDLYYKKMKRFSLNESSHILLDKILEEERKYVNKYNDTIKASELELEIAAAHAEAVIQYRNPTSPESFINTICKLHYLMLLKYSFAEQIKSEKTHPTPTQKKEWLN